MCYSNNFSSYQRKKYTNLKKFCDREQFGHAFSLGGLYVTTSGTSHTAQYGLAKMLEAATNGEFNFIEITSEYGRRAEKVKEIFLKYGFEQVYKKIWMKRLEMVST